MSYRLYFLTYCTDLFTEKSIFGPDEGKIMFFIIMAMAAIGLNSNLY
jgi:hypothetical protein